MGLASVNFNAVSSESSRFFCKISVNNSNLCHISHSFQVIVAYWSIIAFATGVPLFLYLVLDKPLNSGCEILVSKTISLSYRAHVFRLGADHQCDRRMDRITIAVAIR